MPLTLTLFAYTPEALAELSKNPVDRSTPVRKLVEGMGGRLVAFYHCSGGEYHGALILDVPDELTSTAVGIAAESAGHLKMLKTIPLLEVEGGLEALRRAGSAAFQGVGQRAAANSMQEISAEPPLVASSEGAVSSTGGVPPVRTEETPSPREGDDRGLVDEAIDALLGEKQQPTRRAPSREPWGDEPQR